MKQNLTIRIPDDLREELQEISKVESKPVSDLVRESIQKYISIYRFHQLRDKVLPFAEAQGILIDEDVFKLVS
jgi:predicted transcriptional regulator